MRIIRCSVVMRRASPAGVIGRGLPSVRNSIGAQSRGYLRQQITHSIHVMNAGCDPLVWTIAAIKHGPSEVLIEAFDDCKISAKGFESMSTSDIELR